jgi:hypothetical protein
MHHPFRIKIRFPGQKMHMKKLLVFSTLLAAMLLACSKSSNNNHTAIDCSGAAKSWATDVAPIIQSSCATNTDCHAAGSTNGPGQLTTYLQVTTSKGAIRAAVASGAMPKDATLTAAQKSAIVCWIDAGALNN